MPEFKCGVKKWEWNSRNGEQEWLKASTTNRPVGFEAPKDQTKVKESESNEKRGGGIPKTALLLTSAHEGCDHLAGTLMISASTDAPNHHFLWWRLKQWCWVAKLLAATKMWRQIGVVVEISRSCHNCLITSQSTSFQYYWRFGLGSVRCVLSFLRIHHTCLAVYDTKEHVKENRVQGARTLIGLQLNCTTFGLNNVHYPNVICLNSGC